MLVIHLAIAFPLVVATSKTLLYNLHNLLGGSYKYNDSECFLKMVSDSNPEHFARHPLWSHRGFSSHCDSAEYFLVQQTNWVEFVVARCFYFGTAMIGLFVMFSQISPQKFFHLLPLAGMGTGMGFVTSHYMNDNTIMSGGIVHHTNFEENDATLSGVHSCPHGVFCYSILSQFLVIAIVHVLLEENLARKNNVQYKLIDFVILYVPMNSIWLIFNMMFVHPYLHEHNESFYWWPLDLIMQDMNHLDCHHVTGKCLASVPNTGHFHDVLLVFHGLIYKKGYVERLTICEDVLNFVLHGMLVIIVYFHLRAACLLTNWKFCIGNIFFQSSQPIREGIYKIERIREKRRI